MGRMFAIAIKDLRILVRDSAAFLGLIVAPLALSLALGAAFGGGGTSEVPTVVVDLDGAGGGRFGPLIAGALGSDQLSSLIGVTRADDAAAARARVDDGGASVAVVIRRA